MADTTAAVVGSTTTIVFGYASASTRDADVELVSRRAVDDVSPLHRGGLTSGRLRSPGARDAARTAPARRAAAAGRARRAVPPAPAGATPPAPLTPPLPPTPPRPVAKVPPAPPRPPPPAPPPPTKPPAPARLPPAPWMCPTDRPARHRPARRRPAHRRPAHRRFPVRGLRRRHCRSGAPPRRIRPRRRLCSASYGHRRRPGPGPAFPDQSAT